MKIKRRCRLIDTPSVPRLVVALVASFAALGMAAADAAQARLLVNIVVEGLDADYLELLRDRFGEGGFKRFERHGATISHADYGPGLDAAAASATILTGASPSLNGVGGTTVYDRERLRVTETYADPDILGNFSSIPYSPKALRVSTVSDEARIASGGTSVVYAIAPDAATALALGGHAANAALWLDPKTGNWASSTYFKEMPVSVATRNRTMPLSARLDTMSWTPALAPSAYPAVPDHLSRYSFRYVFPHSNAARLDMFKASPLVNREVTTVATDLLSSLQIGRHEGVTDVLGIGYTLEPFDYGKNPDNRVELMDAYVRLDAGIANLLDDIDRRVGLDHTVIMLAGTPPRTRTRRDSDLWGVPSGEFSTRKAVSLLNMYLIALYGNGDFVSAYHNGNIYLNHKLIKERSLDETEVRTRAAAFMARMTGVDRVHTLDEIIAGHAGENAEALRRNTVASSAGDLRIMVAPGFEIVDDYNTVVPADHIPMVERAAATTAPVYILAPGIATQTIGTPVDARAIAPAVCRILRIRSPNGASQAPVQLLKK
ncbi:MAG: alkaline phosphatase family protein [Bacteroidales bacterium]|nr:alkaline phosphatase family protein [Bacteroidales bacterium]